MEKQSLKRQHEKAVVEDLMKCLENQDPQFDRMGDDKNEPDVIYSMGDKRVGVEVVTAYIDNDYAKLKWDFAKGKRKDFNVVHSLPVNSSDLLCSSIQETLKEKSIKSYKYSGVDEVWLCIEEQSPVSDIKSITDCINGIKVEKNRFHHIYILQHSPLHDGGGFKAFRIK